MIPCRWKLFKRKGCPESNACPYWLTEVIKRKDGTVGPESKCIDFWMFTIAWHGNAILEGNQQAIESFRNNVADSVPTLVGIMSGRLKEIDSQTKSP